MRDRFYVEREADARLKREVVKLGFTTTIPAARQTGKSSLLVRGVHHAREHGAKLRLDFADDFFPAIRAIYNARANDPEFNRPLRPPRMCHRRGD